MEQLIRELCRDRVFYHFRKISDIPHGSHAEERLSDYLLHWAEQEGLQAEQDPVKNVFVRKPASAGYEKAEPIMLQAHMDMVCERSEECEHDFAKDPIHWEIDGDMLSTGRRTTLGADDGIGVALAMAILEDPALQHPELEVLFTVAEEEDFAGAEGFDTKKMHASRLINLDHTEEDVVVCGSCGGMRVDLYLPGTAVEVPSDWTARKIRISGMRGGHSGEDIHRGRGNANALLARVLSRLERRGGCLLHSILGGTFRLAIPREAEAVVWLDPQQCEQLPEFLKELEQEFRSELALTGDDLCVDPEECEAERKGFDPSMPVAVLMLCPDGIHQMDEALEGIVDTSSNMGELYMTPEDGLHVVVEIRSLAVSLKENCYDQLQRLAALTGGRCERSIEYPSWQFRTDSELFLLYRDAVKACGGPEIRRSSVHAGLEVGCFFESKKDIDAIAIGPDCRDFHSPTERLSISSAKRVYRYLCQILASMR